MDSVSNISFERYFLTEVKENLKKLEEQSKICVAVSGGRDSIVLLHALHKLKSNFSQLLVIHINHHLRGNESDQDAEFVCDTVKKLGLDYLEKHVDWQESEKKSQAACRQWRQRFYQSIINDGYYIALGHHLDDQAETVLQRLFRGSGLHGLCAMQVLSGNVIRPLLTLKGSQIQKAADLWNLKWREDSSNQKNNYERNWIRNQILPLVEKRRPHATEKIAEVAFELQNFIQANPKINSIPNPEELSEGLLWRLRDFLQLDDYFLVKKFKLERKHIKFIKEECSKKSGSIDLPFGKVIVSQGFVLYKTSHAMKNIITGNSFGNELGKWLVSGYFEKLNEHTMGDGKKIKRELIKQKIPRFFRSMIPVLVDDKQKYLLLPRDLSKQSDWQIASATVQYIPSDLAKKLFN